MVVAYEILVSAQGPLVLGFWGLGLRCLGPGLDNFQSWCAEIRSYTIEYVHVHHNCVGIKVTFLPFPCPGPLFQLAKLLHTPHGS